MDRLRLHEFSKSMDMMDAVGSEISDSQLQRRKKRDQKRDEKIKFLSKQLRTDKNMSPGRFLEEMANNVDNLVGDFVETGEMIFRFTIYIQHQNIGTTYFSSSQVLVKFPKAK